MLLNIFLYNKSKRFNSFDRICNLDSGYSFWILDIGLNLNKLLNSIQIMKVEDTKRIVKIIETTKGHIPSPHSNPQTKITLTIFNQLLIPQCSKHKINIPLDLQHLNQHKLHPYSLQNTSIAWASIQHQLRQVLSRTNCSQNNVLIFDSSNYNQKIPQIFDKFQIVKGYNYRLKLDSFDNLTEDKIALMNEEHVLKQVEMEFGLGNGVFRPGYIGEIRFEEIQTPVFGGIIKAYVNYAAKTKCPIVVNFASEGEQTYNLVFEENAKQVIQTFEHKLNILTNFLAHAREKNCSKNLIIYNLPIVLVQSKNFARAYNHFEKHIERLLSEYNVTLGFKLLRYSKFYQKDGINQIIKQIQKYPNNIILSSGIKYKTDLSVNSGQGLSLYEPSKPSQNSSILHLNSVEYMRHFLSSQTLDKVTRLNILELLDWKEMKEEIIIEVFWKCDNCKGDFSQNVEAFQKFAKKFCSIKCLKSFKF